MFDKWLTIPWTVKQIIKASENKSLVFDNVLQRGLVWQRTDEILVVDSILRGMVLPPLYAVKTSKEAPAICKKGSKVYDCLDGKQRTNALLSFRNNLYSLKGCEPFVNEAGESVDLNGLYYADLDEEWKDRFDSRTINLIIFEDMTDDEIAEQMYRLNNGKPFTGVQHARTRAKNLKAICIMASHDLFKNTMTESQLNLFHNEDVVIKTALQVFNEQFELSTKNVRDAYEMLEFTEKQIVRLEEIFDKANEAIATVKELAKKSTVRKALKKTNLVNIIYLASKDNIDADGLAEFIEVFFDDDSTEMVEQRVKYNEACVNGTNHASNVIARNVAMQEAFGI